VLPLVGTGAPDPAADNNSHSGAAEPANHADAADREKWLLAAVSSATQHAGDMSLAAAGGLAGLPAATQLVGPGGCCNRLPRHATHIIFSPLEINVPHPNVASNSSPRHPTHFVFPPLDINSAH